MAIEIVMIPKVALELNKEIQRHPELMAKLAEAGMAAELHEKIGIIAAHCDMLLDGYYTETDLDNIFNILVDKLRSKRVALLN